MPTVEEILAGTSAGRRQSVGNMDVIPLLGEDDDTFAPPDFAVSNRGYGTVDVRSTDSRPSIVPPGAGWVVKAQVQDHAVCGGKIVKGNTKTTLEKACCIQQSQPGMITEAQDKKMVILPAQLRTAALMTRNDHSYDRLWNPIQKFKEKNGLTGAGNLAEYLNHYEKELDQFVAEFELVPNQIGAVILVDGKVVGIERAPSHAFFGAVWEPLVRTCYGSYSLYRARRAPKATPQTRVELSKASTLEALSEAVSKAEEKDKQITVKTIDELNAESLLFAGNPDDQLVLEQGRKAELMTLANPRYAGQIVQIGGRTLYASMTVSKA